MDYLARVLREFAERLNSLRFVHVWALPLEWLAAFLMLCSLIPRGDVFEAMLTLYVGGAGCLLLPLVGATRWGSGSGADLLWQMSARGVVVMAVVGLLQDLLRIRLRVHRLYLVGAAVLYIPFTIHVTRGLRYTEGLYPAALALLRYFLDCLLLSLCFVSFGSLVVPWKWTRLRREEPPAQGSPAPCSKRSPRA